MIRRTYGSVKEQLARVTQNGMCSDNPQLLARVNEAQERLMNKGLYAGTYGRYSVCVYGGCITLPRELESVLGYNFGGVPSQVYNQWYEFMANGPGIAPAGDWKRLIDRGFSPSFRPLHEASYLRISTDLNEDISSTILFRGSDSINNRIQTQENGVYIDGERLPLSSGSINSNVVVSGLTGSNSGGNGVYSQYAVANSKPLYRNINNWTLKNQVSFWQLIAPGNVSAAVSVTNTDYPWQTTYPSNIIMLELSGVTKNAFRQLDAINKSVSKGWVRIYAVNPTTAVESCVAILAPGETLPHYRRYAIPGFSNEEGSSVTILAKRKFIPIVSDDDDLVVTNLGALKMMMIAIEKEENNNLAEAQVYEDKAVELLKEELKEVEGANIGRPQVQMEMFAMGEIPNMA